MNHTIAGLHHIRSIASSAQRNHAFYTKLLGLRLVKRTVNADDPSAYHLYYGNEAGAPGTLLSVLSWEHIGRGYTGAGMATELSFSVPPDSLGAWEKRFQQFRIYFEHLYNVFGEEYLHCSDTDGLSFNLVMSDGTDDRLGWQGGGVPVSMAIKGLYSVSLAVKNAARTLQTLTDVFGYTLTGQYGNKSRLITYAAPNANIIDVIEMPDEQGGYVAGGTIHHVAFLVNSEAAMIFFREKLLSKGLSITPKSDVAYFSSFYFREPGGILFELASGKPGLTVDESVNELGSRLMLPDRLEHMREKLETTLPLLPR